MYLSSGDMSATLLAHEVTSPEFHHLPTVESRSHDYERESRKLLFHELHSTSLAEYRRMGRIPRGLRSNLRPTLFRQDESYCRRFEDILNRCSSDLMVLTMDYLQRSVKETREKLSAIELQLASLLPKEAWTSLKAKTEKVLSAVRREMEIKKREKFLRDTEDYQLKRVYRCQDPPSDHFVRPTSVRHFTQDESRSAESRGVAGRRDPGPIRPQETTHQSRAQPTKKPDVRHHRRRDAHPDLLTDGSGPEKTPPSSKKGRVECIGKSAGVVMEKSKSRNKPVEQKAPGSGEAADSALPAATPRVPDKRRIATERRAHAEKATAAPPPPQTGPDKGPSQHPTHPKTSDGGAERSERRGSHCKTKAKKVSRPKNAEPTTGNVTGGERSAKDQKKPLVTYPGKRPCSCSAASDPASSNRSTQQGASADDGCSQCRSLVEPKKIRRGQPSRVDRGPSAVRAKIKTERHRTSRTRPKKSHVVGRRRSDHGKRPEEGLESQGRGLFHKVSWKRQECNQCRKKFSTVVIKTRRRHKAGSKWSVRSCVTGQGKMCTDCKKTIQERRRTSGRETFSCTECGKGFLQPALRDLHQKSHLEEKLFVCPLCGKRFVQQALLLLHQKTHAANKPHQCMECGNLFFRRSLFLEHLKTHKEAKPCRCADCGKCFADNTTLVIHQRIHTGEKPFSCDECGKSFSQQSTLVTHQRLHSGEMPYKCCLCGKLFRDRSAFASHQRIHNGEKPFKCQECGKRFTQSCNLRRHERLHMGKKPYVCTKCGKAFNEASKLKSHENVHLKKESREAQRTK